MKKTPDRKSRNLKSGLNMVLRCNCSTINFKTNHIHYMFTDLGLSKLLFNPDTFKNPHSIHGSYFFHRNKIYKVFFLLEYFKTNPQILPNKHKLTIQTSSLQKSPNSLYCYNCPPFNRCNFFFAHRII